MLPYARHRHATRWPRRIIFALAILVLLWAMWRMYRSYQRGQPRQPAPATQVA